jgi:hypothetical protein
MFAAAKIGRVLAGFGLSAAGHQKKQEQSSVRHQPPKNPDLPKKILIYPHLIHLLKGHPTFADKKS